MRCCAPQFPPTLMPGNYHIQRGKGNYCKLHCRHSVLHINGCLIKEISKPCIKLLKYEMSKLPVTLIFRTKQTTNVTFD